MKIKLKGGKNFRDLGGIRTSDGSTVKPGLFLRGAVTGRKAKPGSDMAYIREAIRLWRPLYEQLEG